MTYNPFTVTGKTILVTGASSGIGRAVALEASQMGARLIILGRDAKRLAETFDALGGAGHSSMVCDLTLPDSRPRILDEVPPLDGVVHSAGIAQTVPFPFVSEDGLATLFQTNFFAPFLLTRDLVKKRKISQGGSVVFLSSIDGPITGHIGNSAYAASKGAVSAAIKSMAVELAPRRIRVNAVLPGQTETPLIHSTGLNEEDLAADKMKYPLKRYARPEEIAWGVLYFLSEASSFSTGSGLVIDGGFTLQ
jgi:NAD(P)-dependent dehydrogenase (short-subunit alcohol dehydrogenase family)